jgi:hypothetical protein
MHATSCRDPQLSVGTKTGSLCRRSLALQLPYF